MITSLRDEGIPKCQLISEGRVEQEQEEGEWKRNRFRPMRFCSVKEFMWRRSYGSQNRKEIIIA